MSEYTVQLDHRSITLYLGNIFFIESLDCPVEHLSKERMFSIIDKLKTHINNEKIKIDRVRKLSTLATEYANSSLT